MTKPTSSFAPLAMHDLEAEDIPPLTNDDAICIMPVPPNAPLPPVHPALAGFNTRWEYRSADGALLGYILRWDKTREDDAPDKEIRCLSFWQDTGWQWKHWPAPRPLYGLDQLAQRPNAPVLICEGEKSADAASRLFPDYVCITSPGGANAAAKANWMPLAGRAVTIWPDADKVGRQYAREAAGLVLQASAVSVAVVEIPDTWPNGWDVADELPEGSMLNDLKRMISTANPSIHAAGVISWPEPEPLPALPDVAPFDLDLLPASLRPWIEDIAERVQCPPDFPAVAAMVALGAVTGRKIGVRPKRQDDWLELPNFWGCIIGRPGVMKSPALAEAMKPLRRLESNALEAYEVDHSIWEKKREIADLRRKVAKDNVLKALRKGQEICAISEDADDPEPKAKRYVVNDSSVEALGEILRSNPNGVLAYRDELVSLLKSLDKEGQEGARGFYLTAWSGKDGYTFDRIGRGLDLRIDACCLSLLGSTQPSAISSYLADAVATGGGDGLLSRFGMMVWPDISGTWRDVDRWPDNEAKNRAFAVFQRLDTLDGAAIGQIDSEDGLPFMRFDSNAQEIFNDWRRDLETRLRLAEDHPAFESHLSKYRKLVPALALLSHLADDGGAAICEVALLKALGWAEYLETHARRAYAAVSASDTTTASTLWRRIQKGDVVDGFTERDIYRRDWSGLERHEVNKAVKVLESHGFIRSETTSLDTAGGRPKVIWYINPRARS